MISVCMGLGEISSCCCLTALLAIIYVLAPILEPTVPGMSTNSNSSPCAFRTLVSRSINAMPIKGRVGQISNGRNKLQLTTQLLLLHRRGDLASHSPPWPLLSSSPYQPACLLHFLISMTGLVNFVFTNGLRPT